MARLFGSDEGVGLGVAASLVCVRPVPLAMTRGGHSTLSSNTLADHDVVKCDLPPRGHGNRRERPKRRSRH